MERKNPGAEIEALRKLTTAQLKARYRKVFGEATTSNNKPYLVKRIAYRLQEKKRGGLTQLGASEAVEQILDRVRRLRLARRQREELLVGRRRLLEALLQRLL